MNIEPLLRDLAPSTLAALLRRHNDFALCEDAVQEALIAALAQWSVDGVPAHPQGWLITVAHRRLIEMVRNESARRSRETRAHLLSPPDPSPVGEDDTLTLFLLCCHPSLTPASQVALTLRAVGGLTTAEIARAYLVPEATIAQRISRAKQKIKGAQLVERSSSAVLNVLYLIFNEGYTASSGSSLNRVELTDEAIRLARQLHARLPSDGESTGLLSLMLLTDARRPARTRADGALVPLASQDRSLWNADMIAEGVALLEPALSSAPIGPYLLQAAIAAVHDEAVRSEDTDWPQILGLYDVLARVAPGPMVTLNRIVAIAMVHGPQAGLELLASPDPALQGHHRVDAVRAHLLDLAGDREGARQAYRLAARRTLSEPERRYLEARATDCG